MDNKTYYLDGTLMSIDKLMATARVWDKVIDMLDKPKRNLLAEIDCTFRAVGWQLGDTTLSCYGIRRKGDETEAAEVVDDLEVWLGDTEITAELSESTLNEIVSYIKDNC